MKTFLKKIVLLFALVVFLGIGIQYLAMRFYPERFLVNQIDYALWSFQKKQMEKKYSGKINVVLGDSRAVASLDPHLLSNNYYNLAIGGGTFYESYLALKELLQQNSIDTLILCYGVYHYQYNDALFTRTIPFGFANLNDLKALNEVEKLHNRNIQQISSDKPSYRNLFDRMCCYYHVPIAYRSDFLENMFDNRLTDNGKFLRSEIEKNRGHIYFGIGDSSNELTKEAKISKFEFNPVIKTYLDSVYDLVQREHIYTVLVTSPISDANKIAASPNYFSDFDSTLKVIQTKHPNLTVLNPVVFLPNTMFGDASHLNHKGANWFTGYIKNSIDSIATKSNPPDSIRR